MKKYLFTFLLLLFGCELIVDIDVPFEHPSLVVNSFFNSDSLWTATVTLNRHVLNDNPFQKVNNALVIIYDDGNPIDTLISKGGGLYQSDTGKPAIEKNYQIKVSADNYEAILGQSMAPMPAQILSVDMKRTEGTFDHPPYNAFTLKFKDEPGIKNFYQILLETESEYIDPFTYEIQTRRYQTQIESNDPGLQGENQDTSNGLLIKDVLFDGKEAELSFKTINADVSFKASVILTLRSVSEDYYKYKTTSQLQSNTAGDPFAQPVNVYNNIENGFGIFAGYNQSSFILSNP